MLKTKITKVINTISFIFLIICSHASSLKLGNKPSTPSKKSKVVENGIGAVQTIQQTLEIPSMCMTSLSKAMPPGFCWKKGADAGIIPTDCPPGYFRSLALCFQYCKTGWHHILGICYRDCQPGYHDHPLSCFKHLFDWYFKHSSYIPRSLTNFSHEVPCPGNMYRMGALCYRNCETIGMLNCGIGACIAEGEDCGEKIMQMITQVIQGLVDGISLVLSFGATAGTASLKSVAKNSIKSAVKGMSKQAIKAAAKAMKSALTGRLKNITLKRAKKIFVEQIKERVKGTFQGLAQNVFVCSKVWAAMAAKNIVMPESGDQLTTDKMLNALDVLNVNGIVQQCNGEVIVQDGGITCAKAVVDTLSTFDPTGILTIASAFMHPVCDVPVYKPVDEYADLEDDSSAQKKGFEDETKMLQSVKDPKKCIDVFDQKQFKGNKLTICESIAKLPANFDDKIKSFIVGEEAYGYFFEHHNYQGSFLKIIKGIMVADIDAYQIGDVNLDDMISSIHIGNLDIVSITTKNKQINNYLLKEDFFVFLSFKKEDSISIGLFITSGEKYTCQFGDTMNKENLFKFEGNKILLATDWPKGENLTSCGKTKFYDEALKKYEEAKQKPNNVVNGGKPKPIFGRGSR